MEALHNDFHRYQVDLGHRFPQRRSVIGHARRSRLRLGAAGLERTDETISPAAIYAVGRVEMRHVVVAWPKSRWRPSVSLASAVAIRLPTCSTFASQRSVPVSRVTVRTKFTCSS